MARRFVALLILSGAFLLPLAGALLTGEHDAAYYFQFPPEILKTYPRIDPIGALAIAIIPFVFTIICLFPSKFGFHKSTDLRPQLSGGVFPWWGWLGLGLDLVFWPIAWLDIPELSMLRRHTFTPLWLGYIFTVDALVYWRKGHSLASRNVKAFAWMFPASAILWWLFEYINRFVQNWFYLGVDNDSALEYIGFATPCFATVLPALLVTAELFGTFSWLHRRYGRGPAWGSAQAWAWILGGVGVVASFCMGIWPQYFFPFAWLGPLMVLMPVVHRWLPEHSVLTPLMRGDFRMLAALSFAGPVCGFFWEMWNIYSMPKWEYQVPFVMFGKIFEMPLLGYYGYVPFGWECLLIWNLWMVLWGMDKDDLEIIPRG